MPTFKRYKGKVIAVDFTAKEEAAIDREILKRLDELTKEHTYAFDAMVLYLLHSEFGFGKTRLKRFFDLFTEDYLHLMNHYELGQRETIDICIDRLKADGIDLREWERELEERLNNVRADSTGIEASQSMG